MSEELLRNPSIVGTIDETNALITTLPQISGFGTTDQTNEHITTLSEIPGFGVTDQTEAHITTLYWKYLNFKGSLQSRK
jgi:hypothetical protein